MLKGLQIMMLFLGLCCSFSVLSFKLEPQGSNQLTMSFSKAWLPYIYRNDEGQIAGSDGTLLRKTLQQVGYQLHAYPIPENRLKNIITDGDIDVAIAAFKNETREKSNWFSIPYRKEKVGFAYLTENKVKFQGKSIFELILKNYSLGLNNGAWYGEQFEQEVKHQHKYQCFHIEGSTRRLKMLSLGRIDIIIGDLLSMKATVKELGITNITFGEKVIFEDNIHFMFSKKRVDKTFMHQFNQALTELINQ